MDHVIMASNGIILYSELSIESSQIELLRTVLN